MNENRRVVDEGGINPSGAARRRLIKALGLGTVATVISLDWRSPAIRVGGLPAHAAGSPAACSIGSYELSLAVATGTLGLGVSIVVNSVTVVDNSFFPSFATTFTASGSETVMVVDASVTASSPAFITIGRTCCDFSSEATGGLPEGSHDLESQVYVFQEDGECVLR